MKQRVLAVLVSSVGFVACGSGKGPGDSGSDAGAFSLPPDPLSPLAACLELATAEARFEVSCGRLAQSDVGDNASGYIGARCAPSLFGPEEAAFDAGMLAYSGSSVDCAVSSLTPQSGSASVSCNVGYPELDPSCGQLAWGSLGPGARCSDRYACGKGYFCQITTGSVCGVCALDANLNQACGMAASGALCSAGTCNGSECSPFASITQGCALGSAVCRLPLTCHEEGCQNPQGLDGGCNGDLDCAPGLSCNAFSSHCGIAPGAGGDCSEQSCLAGFACLASDAGNTCAPLAPGGACVFADAGPVCPEFEVCQDGGCVPLSLLGGSCASSSGCALGACSGGTCQLVPDQGRCSAATQCQSQTCDVVTSGTCRSTCQ